MSTRLAKHRVAGWAARWGLWLLSPALLGTPAAGQLRSAPEAASASCTEERTMIAVAQALGVNLVVNRIDAWVLDEEWARVDFESWARNLELGWEWDENEFDVNMFLHPYHGSLYFDAARANCLDFWESVPIAFLGSWTWEYFGETFRPSLNDFFMTGFGGVALGEMLHRVSVSVIDEGAVGSERIWRELGALALNPLGGLNRLAAGKWNDVGPNPPDRVLDEYDFSAKLGARRVREAGAPGAIYSPTLLLEVTLGDFLESDYRAPFDVVRVLSQVSPDGGGLNILRAVGRLWGAPIAGEAGGRHHHLLVNQRFDYVSNPVYHFGEQSVEVGLSSLWPVGSGGWGVRTHLAGNLVMMGAIDAPDAGFGERSNDFGPGVGGAFEVAVERDGVTWLSFYNRARYLHSVSGAPADHSILFTGLELSIPITEQLGVGGYLSGDRRMSRYSELPEDDRSYLETRIYLTWRIASGNGAGR